MSEDRTVVTSDIGNIPWRREDDSGGNECWYVDVEGLHVWVKNYGDSTSDIFSGWRIGRGGSPLWHLNDDEPFDSREQAFQAAPRVVLVTAREKIERALDECGKALTALDEVTTKL